MKTLGILACVAISGLLVIRHTGKQFVAHVENFDETKQPWVSCAIAHPGGNPPIAFLQRRIHPFLAEYEYKLRTGEGTIAVERVLPVNVGGRTKMNAYWYPSTDGFGPCIRLQDHWGQYLLRLDDLKTYRLLRYRDRTYIGEITDSSASYSMGLRGQVGGEPFVRVGDNEALDVTDRAIALGPGEYLGRIDGSKYRLRFVTAHEASEERIDMRYDHMNGREQPVGNDAARR